METLDALNEAFFGLRPFLIGDDSRHEVEREHPFQTFFVSVHREGDSLIHQRHLLHLLASREFFRSELIKRLDDLRILVPDFTIRREGFIETLGVVFPLHELNCRGCRLSAGGQEAPLMIQARTFRSLDLNCPFQV